MKLAASSRLTALIPAHNDAYTLRLCLASIVNHFDHQSEWTPDSSDPSCRRSFGESGPGAEVGSQGTTERR